MFGHLVENLSLIWLNISKYTYSIFCFVQRLSPFDLKQTEKIMCVTGNVCPGLYIIYMVLSAYYRIGLFRMDFFH